MKIAPVCSQPPGEAFMQTATHLCSPKAAVVFFPLPASQEQPCPAHSAPSTSQREPWSMSQWCQHPPTGLHNYKWAQGEEGSCSQPLPPSQARHRAAHCGVWGSSSQRSNTRIPSSAMSCSSDTINYTHTPNPSPQLTNIYTYIYTHTFIPTVVMLLLFFFFLPPPC